MNLGKNCLKKMFKIAIIFEGSKAIHDSLFMKDINWDPNS